MNYKKQKYRVGAIPMHFKMQLIIKDICEFMI